MFVQTRTLSLITGARYRSGRRIASSLAESAVDSLVARRMVKKQQMDWSLKGAHRMLQVRAAVLNGDPERTIGLETAGADPSVSFGLDVRAHAATAASRMKPG